MPTLSTTGHKCKLFYTAAPLDIAEHAWLVQAHQPLVMLVAWPLSLVHTHPVP